MRGTVFLPLVAFVFLTTLAEAAPTKQACVAAYEDTQTSMRRSRLLHARESLQTCLNEACPAVLRADCAEWLKEVEARTPSVVVEFAGADRGTRLFVDGEQRAEGIDGKAMALDPGTHTFRVEPAHGTAVSVDAIVREGEKLKVVRLELPDTRPKGPPATLTKEPVQEPVQQPVPAKEQPTARERPVPWPVYAAAAVGVAAGAGFGWFAVSGSSKKGDLQPCKPECPEDRISAVRAQFIVADVLLGVSVVALGTAAYLFLTRPTVTANGSNTARASFSITPEGGRFTF